MVSLGHNGSTKPVVTKICVAIQYQAITCLIHLPLMPRGKTTTGLALDGAVFDIAQILAYLVHNMNISQLYLGFGHFG